MADTMIRMADDNLCQFMTKEDIHAKAPYVFASQPTNPKVSTKYAFANTETVIDDLDKLGWKVVDCKQQRANKKGGVRSFHMVVFQNPKVFIANGNKVECYPRIILTNSHDGFNSFKFMVGLFRLVCSNGLVIATQKFADISIRHMGYTKEELLKVVAKAMEAVEANISIMNAMSHTTLTEEQKNSLATAALRIREKQEENYVAPAEVIEDILTPTRAEDEGDSLWHVFNVLQEKIIKGNYNMFSIKNPKKKRKARAITGVARDLEINQSFFKVASEYAQAA